MTKLNNTYPYLICHRMVKKYLEHISVIPDMQHLTAGFQDTNANNQVETDDKEKRPTFLLIIAGISGIGAIGLGGMIFLVKKMTNSKKYIKIFKLVFQFHSLILSSSVTTLIQMMKKVKLRTKIPT